MSIDSSMKKEVKLKRRSADVEIPASTKCSLLRCVEGKVKSGLPRDVSVMLRFIQTAVAATIGLCGELKGLYD